MREQLTPERVARDWLTFYESQYYQTRNPVCAWDAIAEALAHNLELQVVIDAYREPMRDLLWARDQHVS